MQALERASRDLAKYKYILDVTVGIVFLGAPLRGTALADGALWVTFLTGIMGKETSKTILEDLKCGAGSLKNAIDDFAKMTILYGLQVRCFYETRQTQVASVVLPRWIASSIPNTHYIVSLEHLVYCFC